MQIRPWAGGKVPAKCPKSHLYSVLEPSEAALGAFSMKTVSLNQAKRHLVNCGWGVGQLLWAQLLILSPQLQQSGTYYLVYRFALPFFVYSAFIEPFTNIVPM